MKNTFSILVIIFYIFQISCNEPPKPKTAEELKKELKLQEISNSLSYVRIESAVMSKNMVKKATLFKDAKFDGYLIEGKIVNKATIAEFKDPKVKVTYYSQTESIIDTEAYVIYEFIPPSSSTDFQIKVYPPQAFSNFNVSIVDLTAILQ